MNAYVDGLKNFETDADDFHYYHDRLLKLLAKEFVGFET